MQTDEIREKLKTLPARPGVYIFKGERERVLYVGKAKNLKNRLRSYFQQSARLEPRKAKMIRKVRDFSIMVTENELEALALEANLIKEYRPRYNVILRDDKNYPYLRLTLREEWPRLDVVRRIKRDGSLYFGPYIPAASLWETLAFIRRNFPIRPCRYRLDRPMRPCIQYQMKKCPAPCAGLVSREEYMRMVKEVELFLKGRKEDLIADLEEKMYRLSEELRYEEAAGVRDRLRALRIAFESQRVISPDLGDLDVIGIYGDGRDSTVQVLFVRNGLLTGGKGFFIRDTGDMPIGELISSVLESFYSGDLIIPREILVQEGPEEEEYLTRWLSDKALRKVRIIQPKRGKKRELLEMAVSNAETAHLARKGEMVEGIEARLRELLGLRRSPRSIGAFDVSTTFGSYSVGAFVWWEEGNFRKEFYRHLKIRQTPGIDDYAMMEETVRRTVRNLGGRLPDLIVIDGGEGQLNRAVVGLREVVDETDMPEVIGVAKKPDRAILPWGETVPLRSGGPEAMLLIRIRDEVHRFVLSFHRKVRGKGLLESRLERIRGVGRKRRLALLRRFGSIDAIRKASLEDLAKVEGMNRAVAEEVLKTLRER